MGEWLNHLLANPDATGVGWGTTKVDGEYTTTPIPLDLWIVLPEEGAAYKADDDGHDVDGLPPR